MITNLDKETIGAMLRSMTRGDLTLIEVRSKSGNRGVALCINSPAVEEQTGLRWIPIAVWDPSLISKVVPFDGQDWKAFGRTVQLEREREREREAPTVAPNMAPARA